MSYIKDLEVGKVYTLIYNDKDKYIAKANGNSNAVATIWQEKEFKKIFTYSSNYIWDEATKEETLWLEACIKANKYIPFESINYKPKYMIYGIP